LWIAAIPRRRALMLNARRSPGDVALDAEALGELCFRSSRFRAVRKNSASPSTNATKLVRSQSPSSNFKEAKTFSRSWSRLMGRMIVVVGNENDLDYPLSMRFPVGGDKIAQRPHI
jgi:hypothetical protein